MRVSGVARDATGVAAVSVNGVAASSVDGFRTWVAAVPLALGDNLLVVETRDVLGNVAPAAALTQVRRDGYLMPRPMGIEYDAAKQRCYVCDGSNMARVGAIDLATGQTTLVSGFGVGSGPELVLPVDLELDPGAGRLILTDQVLDALIGVDLLTGDRTVVSGGGVGAGPVFAAPSGMALDLPGGRAIVMDASVDAVFEVDLASGDRTVISDAGVGGGPSIRSGFGLDLLPGAQRALVSAPFDDALFGVDVATGQRVLVSDENLGLGTPFEHPVGIAALGDTGFAYVTDYGEGLVYSVDLATGNRRQISEPKPLGPIATLTSIDLDPTGERALIADDFWDALLEVDLATGDAAVAYRAQIGTGPDWGPHYGVIVDPWQSRRALVVDGAHDTVVAVDLVSGDRTVVTGDGVGAGHALVELVDLAVDPHAPAPRLLVLDDQGRSVVSVDPASGDRALLSGPGAGAGPLFDSPQGIAIDPDPTRQRALVMDTFGGDLFAVDLASGDRTVISGTLVGTGPSFFPSYDVEVDPSGKRAFAGALFTSALIEIDLTTGDRVEISGPTVGSGPPFSAPNELLFDPARGTILVGDVGSIVVLEVDPATGDRTSLVALEPHVGPGPLGLHGLALRPGIAGTAPMLLLGDGNFGALLAVDLTPDPWTGLPTTARVIVSR